MKAVLFLIVSLTIAMAAPDAVSATARHYRLEGGNSRVGFSADFGSDKITGRFPVSTADLRLDLHDVSNSTVSVTLDASGAVSNLPFAAQAIKGPRVLDTRRFPNIGFRSTSIRRDEGGAIVNGNLTIRGVTRPVSLRAMFWRIRGSDPGDLAHLIVRLTGAISRSAFGASGWSGAVGDEVRLEILANITRVDQP